MIKQEFPKVSVQIINWNGKRFLKDCFDSLLKQDYKNFEIVLVDNASSDGSIDFIKENYKKELRSKKIRIMRLDKNYGFAGGYNRSYGRTNADYVLLINNDVLVPEKAMISLMVKKALSKDNIATVGAYILPIGFDLKKKKLRHPGTLSLLLTNTHTPLESDEIFYVSGCCCMINKRIIDVPFEEEYFAYSEDVYLGWKSALQGYKNVLEPKARLLHYGSGTTGAGSPFVRYYGERNRILNCLIFYEGKTLVKLLPIFSLYFIVSAIFFIHKPKIFSAYIKAYLWILSHPGWIRKIRNRIQKARTLADEELLKSFSSEVFLIEPKITSFYGNLKKRRFFLSFVTKAGLVLNYLLRVYCRIMNIRTRDLID